MLLFDTNVLVDYGRGSPKAVAYIDALTERPALSVIVVAELYAGVRDGRERNELAQFVARTLVLPIDSAVAVQGGLLQRQYRPSHNIGLADALIAATALVHGATLVTLNQKHFPMLPDVVVPYNDA